MPANQKVSVAWQVIFTFIPIVNFWAFYRIRKLRKYLLYVVVPSYAVATMIVYNFSNSVIIEELGGASLARQPNGPTYSPVFWGSTLIDQLGFVALWALQGFSIYLVIIWSRQQNQSFDTP